MMHELDPAIDQYEIAIEDDEDRMFSAASFEEAEHYEKCRAQHVASQAVLFAQKEGL